MLSSVEFFHTQIVLVDIFSEDLFHLIHSFRDYSTIVAAGLAARDFLAGI
jgi:hypothetical protein